MVPEARANPNQTLATSSNRAGLTALLEALVTTHRERCGDTSDVWVGLQLTHSGRFCRPDGPPRPRLAYHNPLLDAKFGIDPRDASLVMSDDEVERLIDAYVAAARLAREVGFHFVDVKACHGYLLHEFLSAHVRPGRFGGDFAGRTRLLTTIVERMRNEVPGLAIGVRLSVFDTVPYQTSRELGQPCPYGDYLPYELGFGVDANDPLAIDLTEPIALIEPTARSGRGRGEYLVRQSVLLPPHSTARHFSAERRLPAAGRSTGGSMATNRRGPAVQASGAGPANGRHRLLVSARLPAARSPGGGAGGVDRPGRAGADGAGLPRVAGRFTGWHTARASASAARSATARLGRVRESCPGCFPLDPYYKAMPEAEVVKRFKRDEASDE